MANFIKCELDLPYSLKSKPKFSHFFNWRIAEKIRNRKSQKSQHYEEMTHEKIFVIISSKM